MIRDLRLVALCALLSLPLTWSATFAADTRTETVNQALASLLLGTLPLLGTLLLFSERFEQDRVEVRYGKNRRSVAARSLLQVAGLMLLFATISATFAMTVYRGPRDPVLLRDLLATLPIAVAGSLAVAGFLACFRSLLGRTGLIIALVLVWVVGSLDLPIAAAVPTGHIRYLIGVGAELPFAPSVSFACLYAVAIVTGSAALLRVNR